MRAVDFKTSLARAVYGLLAASCRFDPVEGAEAIERLRAGSGAAIASFWHSRILGCTRFLQLEVLRRSVPMRVMVSRSEDGEIISRIIESWGAETARGSSSRGGTRAMREMARFLRRPPGLGVTTPDGPRGPSRRAQPGTILLAQLAAVPILPMSFAACRSWRLSSWDRFIVPRPFSRLAIVVRPEIRVPSGADDEERERLRAVLEASLLEADRRAAAAAGTSA